MKWRFCVRALDVPRAGKQDLPLMPMKQIEIPGGAGRAPEALHGRLQNGDSRRVLLTITRNRVSMASVVFRPRAIKVRLHHAFVGAPDAVVSALREYLRRRKPEDWRRVAAFARSIQPDHAAARPARLRTKGRVYDLETVRRTVVDRLFDPHVCCRVGWGRPGRRRRRALSRHIRYGSYVRSENLARINPILDDARVPLQFLEYIVFHEMLHEVVPSEQGLRWNHHTVTFRQLEERFPDIESMRRLCGELVTILSR